MTFENDHTEFKSRFTEEIYKEVIAFANTAGGVVYIGIDNEGNEVGLADVDHEYTRVTNGIRDAVMPDITMCVRYTLQDNKVIRIEVSEGSTKPYYLKSKGLKPGGVYVRQGSSGVPASPEQIRQMIKESDGDIFEEMRSMSQDLTFGSAAEAFARRGVEFSTAKYRTLGIIQKSSGIYTNLALILSDQCPYTTKVAVFSDETCTVFRDSKEFTGSLFRQFEDTVNYLALCNRTASVIKGLVRTDTRDYPEEAIREALLNAFVHRDYSYSGSSIINVNDAKMEFISLGGLLPGLTTEDIRIGISQPRNKNLAEIFHRLGLIESYGTGIRRIYKLYEKCDGQPVITVTPNAFKITLPNMNEVIVPAPDDSAVTYQMREVMAYISEKGQATESELEELLDVRHTRLYNLTREMKELGLLRIDGRGSSKRYVLRDAPDPGF